MKPNLFISALLTIILSGCVSTIGGYTFSGSVEETVAIGTGDFDSIAGRYAQGRDYQILETPNTSSPGEDLLIIRIKDSFENSMDIQIQITVVDSIKPTISLITRGTIDNEIPVGSTWMDPGILFRDNYDKDRSILWEELIENNWVTGQVMTNVIGAYTLTYQVPDSSGNISNQIIRRVRVVDNVPPIIEGPSELTILTGASIEDYQLSVFDNYDTLNIEDIVVDWGNLNPSNPQPGTYNVRFSISDFSGNTTFFHRRYFVLYDINSLELAVLSAISRGNYRGALDLIEAHRESLSTTEINNLLSRTRSNIETILVNEYKNLTTSDAKIRFLEDNRDLLRLSFVFSEMEGLVLSLFDGYILQRRYQEALNVLDTYRSSLTASAYSSKVLAAFSSMSSVALPSTEPTYRELLGRYNNTLSEEQVINLRRTMIQNAYRNGSGSLGVRLTYLESSVVQNLISRSDANIVAIPDILSLIAEQYRTEYDEENDTFVRIYNYDAMIQIINTLPYQHGQVNRLTDFANSLRNG